jgi:hypothetical protein
MLPCNGEDYKKAPASSKHPRPKNRGIHVSNLWFTKTFFSRSRKQRFLWLQKSTPGENIDVIILFLSLKRAFLERTQKTLMFKKNMKQ